MGLKEKRAGQDFATNVYPGLKSQLEAAAKSPIEIDVQWESLQEEGMDHMYAEAWPKVYFEPLIKGISSISADAMGAEALAGSLKKIKIMNDNSHSNPDGITFESGILTINHKPMTNIDNVSARTEKVQNVLENAL
jgi:hypothetical protein